VGGEGPASVGIPLVINSGFGIPNVYADSGNRKIDREYSQEQDIYGRLLAG